MPVPALDQHGLLPVGVHDCTLQEFSDAFCWNAHRMSLYGGLQDFLAQQWAPLNLPADLWLNGSFTRAKDFPEDIDVVADVSGYDNQVAAPAIMLWLNRVALKATYHIDFWVKHPLLPTDLTAFFQYTGLKAGAELGLDAKHLKGILRVAP